MPLMVRASRCRSVIVPVALVLRVPMGVVHIVGVIAVLHRLVPAADPVSVLVVVVLDMHIGTTLVPVPLVLVVGVAFVEIMHVVAVARRRVPAARPVAVRVIAVIGMCRCFSSHQSLRKVCAALSPGYPSR